VLCLTTAGENVIGDQDTLSGIDSLLR
jgi:hypothetical protein